MNELKKNIFMNRNKRKKNKKKRKKQKRIHVEKVKKNTLIPTHRPCLTSDGGAYCGRVQCGERIQGNQLTCNCGTQVLL